MFIDNSSVSDDIINNLTLIEKGNLHSFASELSVTNEPISIGFVNQHAYNLIHKYEYIKSNFDALTFRLRDGAGIEIGCKVNQCEPGDNLNGTDFIPILIDKFLSLHPTCQCFSFGTQEPWLESGSSKLFSGHEVNLMDGFQDEFVYVEYIKTAVASTSPTIILLGMGMPKQERVAELLKDTLSGPAIIVCGGAIIDFKAGRFSRAPKSFRSLGLEWLYRLFQEPKRLFKRYIIGIPMFFYYLAINKWFSSKK